MIIAVVNLKGGVGKTISSIALATAASRDGVKVRVIDTDPQGSATTWAAEAEDAGEPLPFPVVPGNVATVSRLCDDEELTIIDLPPSGDITDAAVDAAGFVVVPTSASPADRDKTFKTVASLEAAGVPHAVLVVRTSERTVAAHLLARELDERGTSVFDTVIPRREALSNSFGHAMRDLNGYEDAWNELKEVIYGD